MLTKNVFIALIGFAVGILIGGYFYFIYIKPSFPAQPTEKASKQVIGFLPYWQLNNAGPNEDNYITTLTYFALNVNGEGHIVKLMNPQKKDPGWSALHSGKVTQIFTNARKKNIRLSLLISSGNSNDIHQMVSKPIVSADTLVNEVAPIMKQYHFQDLNLDIEDTATASTQTRNSFSTFVKEVKHKLNQKHLGTLTVEISPTDAIIPNLIDIRIVGQYADNMIIMAYDYHSSVSFVTGPVAPLTGAGIDLEYDVTSAVEKTVQQIPPDKVIIGMPLYGYKWETLTTAIHAPVIPGTGALASDNRMESFLPTCTDCNVFFDNESQEEFVVYKDQDAETFHQIYFPDVQSVVSTVNLANQKQLSGIALWALGYEGKTMLTPLASYK